jgi:hypothetical protein
MRNIVTICNYQMLNFDQSVSSITFDSSGLSENTYNLKCQKKNPEALILYSKVLELFPDLAAIGDIVWSMIGKTEANQINYFDSTISVFFEGPPHQFFKRYFSLPNYQFVDTHTLKIEINSGIKYLKAYRGDFWNIPIPSLPKGACLGTNFGIGQNFSNPKIENLMDVYFYHDDFDQIKLWCFEQKLEEPVGLEKNGTGLFGVQFDKNLIKPIRIKRYVHPHQTLITDRFTI